MVDRRFAGSIRLKSRFVLLSLGLALPALAQFGGVGGASGMAASGNADAPPVSFRPWANVSGGYSHNLTYLTPAGPTTGSGSGDYYNGMASAGFAGIKLIENGSLTGAYSAGTAFGRISHNRGLSQAGSFQFQRQLNLRNAISIRAMGGSSNGGYGYGAGLGGVSALVPGLGNFTGAFQGPGGAGIQYRDPADNGLVDGETFDSRVTFSNVNVSYHYSFSERLTATVGGGGGIVRRKQEALADLNLGNTFGQLTYSLTQRLSLGTFYGYTHFSYPGKFGGNQIHTAGVQLGYMFNQRSMLQLNASGFKYHSRFVGSIPVPPELAELLGVTSVTEVQQIDRFGPEYGVTYGYRPRLGSFWLNYRKGITPGNGTLLTSNRDAFTASYTVGVGRFSVGAHANYQRWRGITNFGGKQNQHQYAGSVSTRMWSSLHFTSSAGIRQITAGVQPRRTQAFAMVGIGFAPGDLPFGF